MHAHDHTHGHAHHHADGVASAQAGRGGRRTRLILIAGAVATLAYVVLAFVVGLRAHSLALVSEAGHNLTDFLALAMTWLGVYLQTKPPTARKTFGYHRAGVLTALFNVGTLFVVTVLIVVEAIQRLHTPEAVATGPMLWVAVVGLVMNSAIAWFLEFGGSAPAGSRRDVNLQAAFLHMIGDAFATALVIIAAVVIAHTGWNVLDPVLSLVIAGLIAASGWGVFREALNILLEGAPVGMHSEEVAADLSAIEGVQAIHDLHIWSLGSNAHALSAHVQIADIPPSASEQIRQRLCGLLAERYQIRHATLQFENRTCDGCSMANDGSGH